MRFGFVDVQGTVLVRRLASAAAEAAYNPADSAVAYREDTDEFLFRIDGAWVRFTANSSGASPALLGFGANDITGAGTRFLFPWYDNALAVVTDSLQVPILRGGTVRRLVVRQNSPGTPGGSTLTYTALKNGAVQTLSAAMAATASQATDLVNSFTVVAGDRVSFRVVRTGPPLTMSPAGISATMEVAA